MFLETATALVCLSHAIFWEARSESTVAQLAVAQVVINRVNDHRYPDNVCAVVTQGQRYTWNNKLVPNKCQFSFYCDGKPEDETIDIKAYMWAEELATYILDLNLHIDLTDGATHYHADYVNPGWAEKFTQTVCIDSHCFYRWEEDSAHTDTQAGAH